MHLGVAYLVDSSVVALIDFEFTLLRCVNEHVLSVTFAVTERTSAEEKSHIDKCTRSCLGIMQSRQKINDHIDNKNDDNRTVSSQEVARMQW